MTAQIYDFRNHMPQIGYLLALSLVIKVVQLRASQTVYQLTPGEDEPQQPDTGVPKPMPPAPQPPPPPKEKDAGDSGDTPGGQPSN